jgi:hypothetical protein
MIEVVLYYKSEGKANTFQYQTETRDFVIATEEAIMGLKEKVKDPEISTVHSWKIDNNNSFGG